MAQAGYTPIKLYYSATASAVPTAGNLSDGELALNITDGKLFYKDNLGAVQTLASKGDLTTISFGSTGLTPSVATGGAVVVAGTLATTNGGTGLTSFNANGAVYATSSSALTTGTLPTTGGGTGLSSFTANRIFYASSTSAIAQSANLTFDGTTLTAANITDSGLTSGRVIYATTGGNLTDSANFTFDGSNLQIGSQGDLRFGDSDNSNWVAFQSPATVASNVTWTLPSTDGTNGQALTTNGSGTLAWSTVAGAPGGSNTQIQYNNAGAFAGASGLVTDGSNLTLNAQGDLRFADSDSSNWVAFQAPATISSNVTWTLPNADGTSGQFLSTDGSGTLSWATASGGGGGGGTSTTTTQVTATGGQTTFNVTYTVGQVSVYLNGALLAAADYTATNGTTVVLASGATAGDIFTAVVYSSVTAISQLNTNVTVSDSGSNGTITFTTDGTEAMRITNAQLVGIGTASPAEELHVYRATGQVWNRVETGSTSNDSGVQFKNGLRQWSTFVNGGDGRWRVYDDTAGQERMCITSAGSVGIGTSSPSRLLSVYEATTPIIGLFNSTTGTTANDGTIIYVSGADANIKNKESNGGILFHTGGDNERMRLNENGTLLINSTNTTPSGNNNIKLNAVGQMMFVGSTTTQSDTAKGQINFRADCGSGSNNEAWANYYPGVFMDVIVESGNDGFANSALMIRGQRGAATNPGPLLRMGNGNQGSSTFNQVFRVLVDNGAVANSTGVYGSLSDVRLKQDITDASSQWDDIKAVRIRKFRMKSDFELAEAINAANPGLNWTPPYYIGAIAQEIEQVSPGLIEHEGGEENLKVIKYSILYMKAIKALQEAMARIETLEADVAALKAR